jgi:hypothetical protein
MFGVLRRRQRQYCMTQTPKRQYYMSPLAQKTKAVLCEGAPDARAKGSVFVRMVSKIFLPRVQACVLYGI